ncbi:IS30 family transposase [Anaerosoma tenue]|uniref:IS30 family transposase n=1 Tax=Anaerosoma tenue TaxID=2933588 RepID=UPI002260E7B6|nr:IS30 family transposase [Anaerosoma tenue]MCK8115935.1 IS30 family transposase [Anaerosoma tenue]
MHAQITLEERYAINVMRKHRYSIRAIARELGRAPSTISRELRRNLRPSGRYVPDIAHSYATARRRRSRRNTHFSQDEWGLVEHLVTLDWSPEQVSGWLKLHGILSISHETIYLRVWHDKRCGGQLWTHMRQTTKKCRKRYRSRDSRGRLPGKRHISERPAEVESRTTVGHWEIDTIKGDSQAAHSALTVVERKTGYLQMGKLARHRAADATAKTVEIIGRQPHRFKTITADNGTEFHSHKLVEEATGVPFYFATPHHSWERGTNENTNGLIRQYLPKRTSMAGITQADLDAIAHKLNTRPRKRLGFRTPEECYAQS